MSKPHLSFGRIVSMNIGFLGLQFSFGLQQSNMGPIYSYLGADEATLPLLWLAGPITGLLVQPLVGALSDRTVTRFGRRTPYFLIGAILCSLCLFAMPYSRTLWMAAGLLWILDAANNVTMEPYRAYISDRLGEPQRALGFLTQAGFTGLAQTLAYLAPSLLVWWGLDKDAVDPNGIPVITRIAFVTGAILSVATIIWSIARVPELPLNAVEVAAMRTEPLSAGSAWRDLVSAVRAMPLPMRQLAIAMFFQWYAMFAYWQFISFAVSRSLFDGVAPAALRDAALVTGQMGAFYNFVAFVGAFALVPFARRFGAKRVHMLCLALSGGAMLALSAITDKVGLFVPMIGIGLGWAGMMGCTYVMLTDSIPAARTGIYMGIFNMFIVVPMLVESLTMPLIFRPLLGGDARNVLLLAGAMMLVAASATLRVTVKKRIVAVAGA